jgi:Fe-S cluster biogenesis protein NfuA/nitrite reductase/ring-hydroxylating ferredoxin subunit
MQSQTAPVDDLDVLIAPITRLEAIAGGWDESHALTMQALKAAIEDLHKEALRRLIRGLKDDPVAGLRLREALADPVVYGVLRFHGLVKAPLAERLEQALADVRPALESHGGDVQIVAIKAPDTVELRLLGSCHGCPASHQTLSEGIEQAIRARCPEIVHIRQVGRGASDQRSDGNATLHFVSPFALHAASGWIDAGAAGDLLEGAVVERKIRGRSVLLARRDGHLSCFDNSCAHLGLPLEMGEVDAGVITCPYHGFQYLLETGECLTAPSVQLKLHAVRVIGSRVEIRLED